VKLWYVLSVNSRLEYVYVLGDSGGRFCPGPGRMFVTNEIMCCFVWLEGDCESYVAQKPEAKTRFKASLRPD